jgi:hypothetical protein
MRQPWKIFKLASLAAPGHENYRDSRPDAVAATESETTAGRLCVSAQSSKSKSRRKTVSKYGDSQQALDTLLAQAGRGDIAAFENFYELSADGVLRLMRQLVDEARVEELTMELYVMAWTEAASFDAGRESAAEWLAELARRLAGRAGARSSGPG